MTGSTDKFLMVVGGVRQWMSLQEAGITFDNGWTTVEIGGYVRENGGDVERAITSEERAEISRIADDYSASK